MKKEKPSEAVARELGELAATEFGRKIITYVTEWEESADLHAVDLAVARVVEAGHAIPPSLQEIAGQAARLRIEMPAAEHDGYLVYLAERALVQDPPQRGPIDAVWRAAAGGQLSDADGARWTQIVAKRVVEQVIEYKGESDGRGCAAVNAIGLRGRADELYDQRRALELALDFLKLAKPRENPVSWNEKIYQSMASHYPGVEKKVAKKRLTRLEKSLKKSR